MTRASSLSCRSSSAVSRESSALERTSSDTVRWSSPAAPPVGCRSALRTPISRVLHEENGSSNFVVRPAQRRAGDFTANGPPATIGPIEGQHAALTAITETVAECGPQTLDRQADVEIQQVLSAYLFLSQAP